MSHSDEIDYINEGTFKTKCRKLYKMVIGESIKHGIDIKKFRFVSCVGIYDLLDVVYENNDKEFVVSVKGAERAGYKLLDSVLSDHFDIEEDIINESVLESWPDEGF